MLRDHITPLTAYLTTLPTPGYDGAGSEPRNFYDLIGNNRQITAATLSTPPQLLRQTQRFFRYVANVHQKLANNQLALANGLAQLQRGIDLVEQQLLPGRQTSTNTLKQALLNRGLVCNSGQLATPAWASAVVYAYTQSVPDHRP